MKIPEEKELLTLLDKTEQEQFEYFNQFDCIAEDKWDCLPSLGTRLWKLAVEKCDHLEDSMLTVYVKTNKISLGASCDIQRYILSAEAWFLYHADPIHRIVAALIALKRGGVKI